MMYQSAGLPSEDENPAKPFLGAYAEELIGKLRQQRELEPGATALYGKEGLTLDAPGRASNYA